MKKLSLKNLVSTWLSACAVLFCMLSSQNLSAQNVKGEAGAFKFNQGTSYKSSNVLPQGQWKMMANGRVFDLSISGTGSNIAISMSSGTVSNVSWNGNTRTLNFTRTVPGVVQQRYTGHLLSYLSNDRKWRMAGSFVNINGGNPDGWYATVDR